MSDVINGIMEMIGAYEILNNVIPGAIYAALVEKFTSLRFIKGDFIIDIIVYYFVGLLIGRIGSAFIRRPSKNKKETMLKGIKCRVRSLLWAKPETERCSEDNYDDYIKAEKVDAKVSRLSLIGDMYRTLASVSICVLLTIILDLLKVNTMIFSISWVKIITVIIGCVIMAFIFRSAYVKQAYYIRSRVRKCKEDSK